jgi:hypothetical protein
MSHVRHFWVWTGDRLSVMAVMRVGFPGAVKFIGVGQVSGCRQGGGGIGVYHVNPESCYWSFQITGKMCLIRLIQHPSSARHENPIPPQSAGLHLGRASGRYSAHHLRADAAVGEDFQQQRVGQAAIDEVDLAHAGVERVHGAADFRDHAAGDRAIGDQRRGLGAGDRLDQARRDPGSASRPGTSER